MILDLTEQDQAKFNVRVLSMKTNFLAISSFLVLAAWLQNTAAQAQNVLLPSATTTPAKTAPAPAPILPTPVPAAPAPADPPPVASLPSTPVPASDPLDDPLGTGGRVMMPPTQLAIMVAAEKNSLNTMLQSSAQLQQQIASYDAQLQRPQSAEQRASLLEERQSMAQALTDTNAHAQKIQKRLAVLQSGNVSVSDMSMLYSQ
jgi:hypothetical protein